MSGVPRLESARLLHFDGSLALLPGDGAASSPEAATASQAGPASALFYNPFDDAGEATDDEDGGGGEDGNDDDIGYLGGEGEFLLCPWPGSRAVVLVVMCYLRNSETCVSKPSRDSKATVTEPVRNHRGTVANRFETTSRSQVAESAQRVAEELRFRYENMLHPTVPEPFRRPSRRFCCFVWVVPPKPYVSHAIRQATGRPQATLTMETEGVPDQGAGGPGRGPSFPPVGPRGRQEGSSRGSPIRFRYGRPVFFSFSFLFFSLFLSICLCLCRSPCLSVSLSRCLSLSLSLPPCFTVSLFSLSLSLSLCFLSPPLSTRGAQG